MYTYKWQNYCNTNLVFHSLWPFRCCTTPSQPIGDNHIPIPHVWYFREYWNPHHRYGTTLICVCHYISLTYDCVRHIYIYIYLYIYIYIFIYTYTWQWDNMHILCCLCCACMQHVYMFVVFLVRLLPKATLCCPWAPWFYGPDNKGFLPTVLFFL